jgi:hypothetical protein
LYTKIDSWNNTNNVVDHNAECEATSTAVVLICKGKLNKTKFKKRNSLGMKRIVNHQLRSGAMRRLQSDVINCGMLPCGTNADPASEMDFE